jgi:serine/threonine protein kinase
LRWVSDKAIERLRVAVDLPDLSDTKYQLVSEIARGGMGRVYLCVDTELDRQVALKVLEGNDSGGAEPSRMLREARIVARLEHPGIVPVHDLGILPDGRMYYVMKLVRGSRLDEHVKQVTSLSDRLRIFQTLCETVAFAHAHGVIHRDLKPQNIMVGPFGEVLVIDWGVAKLLGKVRVADAVPESRASAGVDHPGPVPEVTADGTVIGTPAFMAPEQARGQIGELDHRTDIYSLGAILFFLLFGQPHVRGASGNPRYSGVEGSSPRSARVRPPRPVEAICLKAMAGDPSLRYTNASDLSADIGQYLDGEGVTAYKENHLERLGRWFGRHRFIVLLVAAYLLMRIILLLYSRG